MANDIPFVECMIDAGYGRSKALQIQDAISKGEDIDDMIEWAKDARREQAYIQYRTEKAIQAVQEAGDDPKDVFNAIVSLMGRSSETVVQGNNIEATARFYQGQYHKELIELIAEFRTKFQTREMGDLFFAGNRKGEEQLVKAIYGDPDVSPEMKEFAKTWLELAERVRRDFVTAGGTLHKNENWLLPQHYSTSKFKREFGGEGGKEKFKEFMRDKLDTTKMRAGAGQDGTRTRKQPTPEEVEDILDAAYESIGTGGWSKQDPHKPFKGAQGLPSRHNKERVLYFTDAEAWQKVHNLIGQETSLFDSMMNHLDRMATDVATLEVLPPKAFEAALVQGNKQLAGQADTLQSFGRGEKYLRARYANAAGRLEQGTAEGFARGVQEVKNIVTAGKLGKATLAALADTAFGKLTASHNGLSYGKMVARQMSVMFGGDNPKKMAIRAGLTADAWATQARSHSRFGDSVFVGWTGKMAQAVIRGSGLAAWTQGGRQAFGLEFNFALADAKHLEWDGLDANMRASMEHYDIDAKKWDKFRAQELNEDGLFYLGTTEGKDFHRMIMGETDFAVPTPDAAVQTYLNAGYSANTTMGQLARLGTNLKAFPITIQSTHWGRMMAQKGAMDKATYAGYMALHTMAMGMMAVVAIDVINGKELPNFEDEGTVQDLMLRGFLKGGSGGLLADMFMQDPTAYGSKGYADRALAVPAGGVIDDITSVAGLNLWLFGDNPYDGEKHALQATEAMRRTLPSVWYAGWLTTMMGEATEEMVAPGAYKKKRAREERKLRKEEGRGFWTE